MRESAAASIAHLLLVSLPKFLLSGGGIVLIVMGLFSGPKWGLVLLGISAIIVSQIIHAIDAAMFDAKLVKMAEAAIGGLGPIPPKGIRKAMAKQSLGAHNFNVQFMSYCLEWSRAAASIGGVSR